MSEKYNSHILCYFIFLSKLLTFCAAKTDRTLEQGAFGEDVTDAVLKKIDLIFPLDDHFILRRIAWVESSFGAMYMSYFPSKFFWGHLAT